MSGNPHRPPTSGYIWFFLCVILLINSSIGLMIYQQMRIARFPTTPGVVEDTVLEEHISSTSSALMRCPQITFRYTVAGTSYSGDQFRFGGYCASDLQDVDRVLQNLYTDGELQVFYNPTRPAEAYLTMGMGPVEHTFLLFFLPFNIFALGWILHILLPRLSRRVMDPTTILFGEKTGLVWARFPRLGPIKFTLGMLLIVSFPIALGSVVLFDVLPAPIYRWVWFGLGIFILLCLLGRAAWNHLRPAVAHYERRTGTFTMPGGNVLRRGQIVDWEIEEPRGKDGSRRGFRPVLLYRGTDHSPQRAVFPTLADREAAYRFSDWLVRHLGLPDRDSESIARSR